MLTSPDVPLSDRPLDHENEHFQTLLRSSQFLSVTNSPTFSRVPQVSQAFSTPTLVPRYPTWLQAMRALAADLRSLSERASQSGEPPDTAHATEVFDRLGRSSIYIIRSTCAVVERQVSGGPSRAACEGRLCR